MYQLTGSATGAQLGRGNHVLFPPWALRLLEQRHSKSSSIYQGWEITLRQPCLDKTIF